MLYAVRQKPFHPFRCILIIFVFVCSTNADRFYYTASLQMPKEEKTQFWFSCSPKCEKNGSKGKEEKGTFLVMNLALECAEMRQEELEHFPSATFSVATAVAVTHLHARPHHKVECNSSAISRTYRTASIPTTAMCNLQPNNSPIGEPCTCFARPQRNKQFVAERNAAENIIL